MGKKLEQFMIYFAIIVLTLALLDSYVNAEPYLVYSPNIKVIGYQVEVNGEVSNIDPNVLTENSMQLVYDLVDLPVGANLIRARAQFEHWGWCEWSEPYTVIRPSRLENPQITTNPQLP